MWVGTWEKLCPTASGPKDCNLALGTATQVILFHSSDHDVDGLNAFSASS